MRAEGGRVAGVVTGQDERGFDVDGRVREGRVGGQRALLGQVQDAGFGVGVDVERGGGQEERRRRTVHGPAAQRRGGNAFGNGSGGTRSRVRDGERGGGGQGGRGGDRERVRRGRPLLLWGGTHVTGVRAIGRRLVTAEKICKIDT